LDLDGWQSTDLSTRLLKTTLILLAKTVGTLLYRHETILSNSALWTSYQTSKSQVLLVASVIGFALTVTYSA